MTKDNICVFVPSKSNSIKENVSILNMVKETNVKEAWLNFRINGCYSFNVVTKGSGKLITLYKSYNIKKNDFFITYPSTSYKLESDGDLEFIYISFLGNLLLEINDKLIISKNNPVISLKDNELINYYSKTILDLKNTNNYFIILSVLYLTISKICKQDEEPKRSESSIATFMKTYIEENYNDPKFKLETIVEKINYHPNYLSSLFKKEFNVSFSSYLQTVRLSNSLHLINNGLKSVKEIAYMCGFNDSLYFSRVFKKAYGVSPKYIIGEKTELYKLK